MQHLSTSSLNSPKIAAIHGCWLGKSIGGTLGLPAEGKRERLNFSFYDPIPTSAPPNDDLELQLVWLHLVEQGGRRLSQADFGQAWLKHIHYMWDEYGRCRWNLRRGVPVESCGTFENFFHAGMGAPIRSELWACLFPGDPQSAAHYAAMDASLDHGIEGIAGEVFFSVMQNLVAAGTGIISAIDKALNFIPSESETARSINLVRELHGTEETWECRDVLLTRHGNDNFTHAPLNVALTVWALLYGQGDFETSVLLAVNGGYDTDCTAATVGATLGLHLGAEGIPSQWSAPIGEAIYVGPGIREISAPSTLTELTERTMALIGKLEPRAWNLQDWTKAPSRIELSALPATIHLTPLSENSRVPWANGELPGEVKRAGGGEWTWRVGTDDPYEIICLATSSARLLIDGNLVIQCPPKLPYLPATHRCPDEARVTVNPGRGIHRVRVELGKQDIDQAATVLLAYPDLHIAPWTNEIGGRATSVY